MRKLQLTLLGATAVTVDGRSPLQFRTDKIRALLIYLALEAGRPHQRASLAALLWPEMSQQTALKNLRHSLHRLQQTLDGQATGLSAALLIITRQTISGNPALIDGDALAFQELLAACESHPHRRLHLCHDCLERLTTAVTLYQGELLAGFNLPDAAPFEEWLFFWRERLQQQAVNALGQLAEAQAERGDIETALTYARRLVALDPFGEEAHRLIMRLLARSGRHGSALAQYESCRRLLQAELGVEPAAETTALYRRIQAEQRGETAVVSVSPAALHHFPVQFTPFIGRKRELQQIEELFLDPDCRLATLLGPGGIGKSRLVMQAGEWLAAKGDFNDGVYFFPLAAVRSVEALLTSLLNGLAITVPARSAPQECLLNYLRDRRCLLILDNFEQLIEDDAPSGEEARPGGEEARLFPKSLASVDLLVEMLAAAPGLRLLATSQLPLNIQAERRLTLQGLDYPPEPVGQTSQLAPANRQVYLTFSAVHLFVESARQAGAAFRLTADNETAVIQICQLVEGVPLALELAAAWTRFMDCAAIAREIGRSPDFLSLSPQDKPARHQSMAAVFAHAWRLLPPAEQRILGQLTVFRGPFSLEAAMAITEVAPLTLARLLDRSLLQRRQGGKTDGRYHLHELLRQFVNQQTAGQHDEAARRHSDYYLNLVAAQEKAFYGPQPRQAVAAVQPYLSNIRQAWRWAVEHNQGTAVAVSLEGLGRFYQTAALLPEGEAMFAQAINGLGDAPHGLAAAPNELAAPPRLLVWQAYFLFKLGQTAAAATLARRALGQVGADEAARAEVHSLLGELLPREGDFVQGKAYQKEAIAYFQATADLGRLARALRRMALVCWRSGNHDETLRYFQQAIPIHQALEEKRGLAQLYNVLAGIYYEREDLPQALAYVRQAQELYEAVEDKLDAAVVTANLARLYSHVGQFEEALASNQRAIEISEELGDRPGLARDLSSRGHILAAMGEFERSLDYYYRALAIAQAQADKGRIADFQAGLAAVYAAKGDDETALSYYDLALPVLQGQGVPFHLAGPLLGKAEALYRRGEWAAARVLNEDALALVTGTDLTEYIRQGQALAAKLDLVPEQADTYN